jgi:hypothetical protein
MGVVAGRGRDRFASRPRRCQNPAGEHKALRWGSRSRAPERVKEPLMRRPPSAARPGRGR